MSKAAYQKKRKDIADFAGEFLRDYEAEIKDLILCDAPEATQKIKKMLVDFAEYLEPESL